MKNIKDAIVSKLNNEPESGLRNISFWGISYDFYYSMRELLYFIDDEINRTK